MGRLVPGDPPDDDFKRAVLFAAVGSLLALGGALLLTALPSGDAIRESDFYLVGGPTLAGFVDGAANVALPLAISALCLLGLTGILWVAERQDGLTGAVCVIQPIVGVLALGGSGVVWVLLLAVIALNLAIYLLIGAFLIAFFIGVVTGGGRR